jgi:hypothetical protein
MKNIEKFSEELTVPTSIVIIFYFIFLHSSVCVRLNPLGTSAINWPTVPAPAGDLGGYGTACGMGTGKGNRNLLQCHFVHHKSHMA